MNRRDLFRLAALGALLPGLSHAIPIPAPRARSLILVELAGGNDGLNTLVPYRDPEYLRLRPRLAIPAARVLTLDETVGLNPALRALMPAWDAGDLAWVHGVGYAQPNRSHFRSTDIWETASDSDEVIEDGWLARTLPIRAPGDLPEVLVLSGSDGPARGDALRIVSLQTPERFAKDAADLKVLAGPLQTTPALAHILAVRASTKRTGAEFQQAVDRLGAIPALFPETGLGRQLKEVARILIAGMEIPVFKVKIGSFDTHSGQLARHRVLLNQLADALAAFRQALTDAGHWDRVLVISYSEFGRRVAENASGGTDHGTAAPHFVLGGCVKGGIYGEYPNLTALVRGDPQYTTDYRRMYTTILQRWWSDSHVDWLDRFPAMDWL